MNRKAGYFKLGLFALVTFGVIVFFVVLLGAGSVFNRHYYAETYFDESVQGLDVGSPVKYRGMTIGQVQEIDTVSNIYGTTVDNADKKQQRYIYAKLTLEPKIEKLRNIQDASAMNQQYIEQGLRVRLATQDLVGNVYLELNFVDPKANPVLPISWTPKHFYIPSTKSSFSRFADSIDKFLNQLNNVDLAGMVIKLNSLLETSNKTMGEFGEFTTRLNQLTASQQQNIDETIGSLRQTVLNFELISEEAKNNPSSLIFGKPKEPVDPSK